MHLLRYYCLFICIIMLTSCAGSKIHQSAPEASRQTFEIIPPVISIEERENNNRHSIDSSILQKVDEQIKKQQDLLLSDRFNVHRSTSEELDTFIELEKNIILLYMQVKKHNGSGSVQQGSVLDKFIENQAQNFVLITTYQGYVSQGRNFDAGNDTNETVVKVDPNYIYIKREKRAFSEMWVAVIKKATKEIVYTKRNVLWDEPVQRHVIRSHVNAVIKKLAWGNIHL